MGRRIVFISGILMLLTAVVLVNCNNDLIIKFVIDGEVKKEEAANEDPGDEVRGEEKTPTPAPDNPTPTPDPTPFLIPSNILNQLSPKPNPLKVDSIVAFVKPEDGQKKVAIDSRLLVVFTGEVNVNTLISENFIIRENKKGSRNLEITVIPAIDDQEVVRGALIIPSKSFNRITKYNAGVTTDVLLNGNKPTKAPYAWTFTTMPISRP